jgi:hypothetical protein
LYIRVLDVLTAVTLSTLQSLMLSRKQKARLLVIEILRLPPDQFKGAAMMLFVTFRALELSGVIVVSVFREHTRLDFTMTVETVLTKTFLTEVVTGRTLVHAFQCAMRIRKLSRRS